MARHRSGRLTGSPTRRKTINSASNVRANGRGLMGLGQLVFRVGVDVASRLLSGLMVSLMESTLRYHAAKRGCRFAVYLLLAGLFFLVLLTLLFAVLTVEWAGFP